MKEQGCSAQGDLGEFTLKKAHSRQAGAWKELPHTLPILLPAVSDGRSCHCQRGRSGHCDLCGLLFPDGISLIRGESMKTWLLCNPLFQVKAIPGDGAV